MDKELIIIVAIAQNGVIGNGNKLPWKLPDDMKFFSDTTKGHTVIMGRKSWDSIPSKFKPLPDRRNIVLSKTFTAIQGCDVFDDLQKAIDSSTGKVFIIGGAEIYSDAIPLTKKFLLTQVNADVDGDVKLPQLKAHMVEFAKKFNVLKETSRVHHPADEKHQYSFDFVCLEAVAGNLIEHTHIED